LIDEKAQGISQPPTPNNQGPTMERGPLIDILREMKDTDKELDIILFGGGEDRPFEIRNVVEVEELKSSQGIRVTTEQNYIWLDASHVSAAYQARSDLP